MTAWAAGGQRRLSGPARCGRPGGRLPVIAAAMERLVAIPRRPEDPPSPASCIVPYPAWRTCHGPSAKDSPSSRPFPVTAPPVGPAGSGPVPGPAPAPVTGGPASRSRGRGGSTRGWRTSCSPC